jgi:hypothetical protein
MPKLSRGESAYRLMILVLVLVVIVLFFRPFSSSAPTSSAVPGSSPTAVNPSALPGGPAVSAVEACQLPPSALKGGQVLEFQWQLVVRGDTPAESVLFFTSGTNDFLCQAWRDTTGHYDSVVSSLGGFQATNGAALTYEISLPPQAGDLAPSQLIIGQLPTGTASVKIVTSDQEPHQATLGHSWYLAWISLAHVGDKVIEIDALGANGINITYLANSAGLSVGATAAVSN